MNSNLDAHSSMRAAGDACCEKSQVEHSRSAASDDARRHTPPPLTAQEDRNQRHNGVTGSSGVLLLLAFVTNFWTGWLAKASGAPLDPNAPWQPGTIALAVSILFAWRHTIIDVWRSLISLKPGMSALMLVPVCFACGVNQWAAAATLSFLFALSITVENWNVERAASVISTLFVTRLLAAARVIGLIVIAAFLTVSIAAEQPSAKPVQLSVSAVEPIGNLSADAAAHLGQQSGCPNCTQVVALLVTLGGARARAFVCCDLSSPPPLRSKQIAPSTPPPRGS